MEGKARLSRAFAPAFRETIPVLAGYMILAIAYGVLMQTKGYGPLWSVLMSIMAYCGSMQFAAITLLASAFDPLGAFLLSLFVNARHLFYGVSMLDKYRGMGALRFFLIYTLTDETFSIECTALPPAGVERKYFYFWISLLDYLYWITGTLIGGVLGDFITFDTTGLDFALTALFTVMFTEQLRAKERRPAALMGAGVSLACLLIFGADNFILPAMAAMLVITAVWRVIKCRSRR